MGRPLSFRKIENRDEAERLWGLFAEAVDHPKAWFPWTSLAAHEEWKRHLERGVPAFWTLQGERLALLAAFEEDRPVGLVRVLKVRTYPWDQRYWGEAKERGEIQDLLHGGDAEVATELVRAAVSHVTDAGLSKFGFSAWRRDQCDVLRSLGYRPVIRYVLMGWFTGQKIRETAPGIRIRRVKPGKESLVQRVFSANWGIPLTGLPRMEVQDPLVALLGGEPVGTVLPNEHSGSIDLGVQVLAAYRRRGIGTALLREALKGYRKRGFPHMFLIRALPPAGLRPEDEVALQFYMANGARLLREYTCFQPG